MRITICGSMQFARDMLEARDKLEMMGHEVFLSPDTEECVTNPGLNTDFVHCSSTQIDKKCFDLIAGSDAILVANPPKNGMKGYIGGATLMEIGLARHLDRKIFIMNEIPSPEELSYAFEIRLTNPVILNGDLEKIA